MIYVQDIHMGEGVSGANDLIVQTSALYSCLGIAFINSRSQLGGLYHYPSGEIRNPNVRQTLRSMIQVIQPDRVVITPAPTDAFGIGSTQTDIDSVQNFLATELNVSVVVTSETPKVLALIYWQNGTAVTDQLQPPNAAPNSITVRESLRSRMSPAPRSLSGDIFYYGGDGEAHYASGVQTRPGTLDQGISPAPVVGTTRPGFRARMRSRFRRN